MLGTLAALSLATVLSFLRGSLGNHAGPISAGEVGALRARP